MGVFEDHMSSQNGKSNEQNRLESRETSKFWGSGVAYFGQTQMTESKRLAMHSKRNLEESMRPLTYKTCKDLQAPQALEVPLFLCSLGTCDTEALIPNRAM